MNANKKPTFYKSSYPEDTQKAKEFLTTFTDQSLHYDDKFGKHKYMIELFAIANKQSKRLDIYIEDLENLFVDDPSFVNKIVTNTASYQRLFYEAADEVLKDMKVDQTSDDFGDLINQQRLINLEDQDAGQINQEDRKRLPRELLRKYELYFLRGGQTKEEILSVRQLQASHIGQLVTVRAMVVRVSDVKPYIVIACYNCDSCGFELYQTVQGKHFNPKTECESDKCKQNNIRGKLIFNNPTSKFMAFQEIKIQELTEQLPKGAIPRTFTVEIKGESNIRQCTPGDRITLQGVFLPNQKEGYMANKSLIFNTHIHAYRITRDKKKYAEVDLKNEMALQVIEEVNRQNFQDFYNRIAKSIAPEIYGMEDVKKALLLMMVTGVSKEMHDGMRIRGDINVALIGDPGVAKSQLLKFIYQASPRAIYTTGKGSSSVGLTAAVIRDEITNEMQLEGGALVMADMGICCIDEFDKMNESDRTAIHEVMEQQTVSIAKAGITTTLNARTSILAAANPLYGRYNKKISPHANINLPAALLSRFDLIFILLDQTDPTHDELLARHIGYVHRHLCAPQTAFKPYSTEFIKTYIAMAKQYEPVVTSQTHEIISQKYVHKRQEDGQPGANDGYTYTTPRTLLAIIRLSQALAKCRFSKEVSIEDVDEAIRLMEHSQDTVREATGEERIRRPQRDKESSIFIIIKEMCNRNKSKSVSMQLLLKRVIASNYTEKDLQECLDQYKEINCIVYTKNQVSLTQ